MAILDIVYSILLNVLPLVICAVPLIFVRKRAGSLFYQRLYYGLCVFFLIYWVFPSLLNIALSTVESEKNIGLGIEFILARTISMLFLYAQYPFYVLPFIFIIAPVISLLLLSRRLKTEPGTSLAEKLSQLNYSFDNSPREMIIESLKSKDWGREKEIFKAFLIVLPISLYLLTVILDIAKVEPVNVSESTTALGWFIEILFVYLATFLFSFQLVARSKVSYKGRFIGEQLQTRFFSSLSEVGTPIAILSVILFIAQKTQSLLLVVFFAGFFVMSAFIFIVFLRIFEPISILLFIKLLNWWKIKKTSGYKTNWKNMSMAALYGVIAAFISLLVLVLVAYLILALQVRVPNGQNFLLFSLIGSTPSLDMILLTDILSAIGSAEVILVTIFFGYILSRVLRMKISLGVAFLTYSGVLLLITLILSPFFNFTAPVLLMGDQAWTSGAPVKLGLFGFEFFTMRTAFLTADFTTSPVLWVLSFPYVIMRPFAGLFLIGTLISFFDKRFRSKTVPADAQGKLIRRITYSNLTEMVTRAEFTNIKDLVLTAENVVFTKKESEELMDLHASIKSMNGMFTTELIAKYPQEVERLYTMLKYLTQKNYSTWWIPEFEFTYERAKLDGLYVLYSDGRDLFYHNFRKDKVTAVDPALVSGMFSAITSFIMETTKSSEKLAAIDAGDKKVILEYSQTFPIFAALFSSLEASDIRIALKNLLVDFDSRHKDVLRNWSGNMDYFQNDIDLVQKYFVDFIEKE